MDVSLAATTLNLLGDLRRRLDMAMLFVTHDLAAARIIADRIAVLKDGEVVEVADPDAIIAAPQSAYTRVSDRGDAEPAGGSRAMNDRPRPDTLPERPRFNWRDFFRRAGWLESVGIVGVPVVTARRCAGTLDHAVRPAAARRPGLPAAFGRTLVRHRRDRPRPVLTRHPRRPVHLAAGACRYRLQSRRRLRGRADFGR